MAVAMMGSGWPLSTSLHDHRSVAPDFQMKFAPHLGMFRHLAGEDPIDQLSFMADQGYEAFERNGMRNRDTSLQERMASTMARLGIEMDVFVAHKIHRQEPNLASGKQDWKTEFLEDIVQSVEVAKRVDVQWMAVVPGRVDLRQDMGYQTAHVIDSLKQASGMLEPYGITMVLEPLNLRDHIGLFLTKIAQGYEMCKAVDSPPCKILCDVYHQQIQEGNIIPNIDLAFDEIAYFQIGDHPGRKVPTTGEINYHNVFKHIHDQGYSGISGMEHGNTKDSAMGEQAVIEAYRRVDIGWWAEHYLGAFISSHIAFFIRSVLKNLVKDSADKTNTRSWYRCILSRDLSPNKSKSMSNSLSDALNRLQSH